MKKILSIGVTLCAFIQVNSACAFTLFLDNGWFYGPGNAVYNDTETQGMMKFVDAQVRNIEFSGPFTGQITFFNNGEEEPNVIAEKLQVGGIVDGKASDGTLINENGDTALRLNFSDPDTGESADFMVIPEASPDIPGGGEPITTDEKGNLVFKPSVVADPGQPSFISRFSVKFTTGAAQVPLSLKTQAGYPDGHDNAGPLKSGQIVIGRMGDYDQDGFMDGHLVLADNAPMDLLVGRGNPISQRRPWSSDIPIDPVSAGTITLNNIVQNYPEAMLFVLSNKDPLQAIEYLNNIDLALQAVRGNLRRALMDAGDTPKLKKNARTVLAQVKQAKHRFQSASERLDTLILSNVTLNDNRQQLIMDSVANRVQKGFSDLVAALTLLAGLSNS